MTETTTTPPDACPICDAPQQKDWGGFTYFECGATWYSAYPDSKGLHWAQQCPHLMTAALRCHATLTPTAAEQAREALVAAIVAETLADQAFHRLPAVWSTTDAPAQAEHDRLRQVWQDARTVRIAAVAAYLAAGPQVPA